MSEKLKDKYTGCMLGAAVGDALGKQNEGLARSEITRKGFAVDYGTAPAGCPGEKLKGGQYTDDTEQMLILACSLLECGGLDAGDFAARIAKWGADAQADPARRSLVGPSSSAAIARLNSGVGWKESGSELPSCGSAMRAAPVGLFYSGLDEVESNAALSSVPTHNSRGALAGAVAVAVGVRCALDGRTNPDIVKEVCARASKYDGELAKKIELSFERRGDRPDDVFAELGTSYLVYETVPCVFYCFSRHFGDTERAIIEAVNAGGDTDSIACITGALCGALCGIDSIPKMWVEGLENEEAIERLAGMIFEKAVYGKVRYEP